jgi:hypothetical protein
MPSAAERLQAARERDEQGIEQDEPNGPTFEAPENPTEPEPEPGEPEPEPKPDEEEEEAAGGLEAAQVVDLEKATAAYFKRIEKVFGADSVPPACTHCGGLGFDLTGGAGEPELAEHENYIECADCRGFGHVKTGSKVPGHDTHDCPVCLGRGYLEKLPTIAAVPTEQPTHGTPSWMGDVQSGYPAS